VRARRAAIGKLIAEGILKADKEDPRFYRPVEPARQDTKTARDPHRQQPDQETQLTLAFEILDADANQ
jgi:hypothetical protein